MDISHERCPGSGRPAQPIQYIRGDAYGGYCPVCRRWIVTSKDGRVRRHNSPVPEMEAVFAPVEVAAESLIKAIKDYERRFGYKRKWTLESQMIFDGVMELQEAIDTFKHGAPPSP
jgi:hypothetical protein